MADSPRYLVVVHGIGQQRHGETLLPVVQRIAEARRAPRARPPLGNPLTLPALVAASRDGFSEFAGIPQRRPEPPLQAPWAAAPAVPADGDDLRFVDLFWADIPRADFPLVGQSFAGWSAGLIERLERGPRARAWIQDLLKHMRRGLVPVQAMLALRARSLTSMVFDDFLGDVQLYAEYAPTRGRAVRRFHDRMARLHAQHTGAPPRYTVLAHSLGSVLALDALTYAHAAHTSRASAGPGPDRFHLPGYHDGSELPSVEWAQHVDHFVTLGSPIDKFLLLWPDAFGALGTDAWLDPGFVARRPAPIRHANYCDEQDPVGHELDVARSTPVVRRLFETLEDRVFARYVLPGTAHVRYWQDDALFRRIVDLAVDGREPAQAQPIRWFRDRAYFGVLTVTYVALPVTGWVLSTIACAYMLGAIEDRDWAGALLNLLLCSGAVAATIWLAHLMVMWRQVLYLKRLHPVSSPTRLLWRWLFRALIFGTPPLWAAAAWYCAHSTDWCGRPLPRAATVLATIVSTSLLLSFVTVRAQWRALRRDRARSWAACASGLRGKP
ncbi:MAG: hypothetical protein AB7O97_10155 [Planctomycetota bacterium]